MLAFFSFCANVQYTELVVAWLKKLAQKHGTHCF